MSEKKFLLIYIALVAIGFFGIWLGFQTHDPGNPKMLLGPLIILAVVVTLLLVFRRDLRRSEREKKAEWERARVKGRLNYVLGQVGLAILMWGLFLLSSVLFDLYWAGEGWGAGLHRIKRQAVVGVIMALTYYVGALTWWHFQEKKYKRLI